MNKNKVIAGYLVIISVALCAMITFQLLLLVVSPNAASIIVALLFPTMLLVLLALIR